MVPARGVVVLDDEHAALAAEITVQVRVGPRPGYGAAGVSRGHELELGQRVGIEFALGDENVDARRGVDELAHAVGIFHLRRFRDPGAAFPTKLVEILVAVRQAHFIYALVRCAGRRLIIKRVLETSTLVLALRVYIISVALGGSGSGVSSAVLCSSSSGSGASVGPSSCSGVSVGSPAQLRPILYSAPSGTLNL